MNIGFRRAVLGVAAATMVSGGTATQEVEGFETGNTLNSSCSVTTGQYRAFHRGVCLGYSVAIADLMGQGISIAGHRACIPLGVSTGQVRDVVTKWLRENPQHRHYPATWTVAQALAKAFPCR